MRALAPWALLLFLAGLFFALRHDLALLCLGRGRTLVRSGEYRAALVELASAERFGANPSALAFDRGTALYRVGDFRGGAAQFAAAGAAAMASTGARFNESNALARLGASAETKDPAAALGFLGEAERGYLGVLDREPAAADARQNLALVRAERLRLLARRGAPAAEAPEPKGKGEPPPAPSPLTEPRRAEPQGKGAEVKKGMGAKGETTAGKGHRAPPRLSRERAEELLGEARSRELPLVFLPQGKSPARAPRIEKQW